MGQVSHMVLPLTLRQGQLPALRGRPEPSRLQALWAEASRPRDRQRERDVTMFLTRRPADTKAVRQARDLHHHRPSFGPWRQVEHLCNRLMRYTDDSGQNIEWHCDSGNHQALRESPLTSTP